ncbi:helix-turn-helix domain-containing protein [Magnetospirillum sp. ME-1]|uniref:helix-turn-helix domain-containing protein n=1 Tax=Magnetospirillum sp. ME-1 TaxID=1639348 RepID=UPI000A197D8B|nr:helix-turn-helix domain-containing protein [Magnetospirillum sp. ME-1]
MTEAQKPYSLAARMSVLSQIIKDPRLNDSSRRVGFALINRINSQNGQCFPSYERIASDVGLSRAAVATAIKTLLLCGYFTYTAGGGNKNSQFPGERRGRSNVYQLQLNQNHPPRAQEPSNSARNNRLEQGVKQSSAPDSNLSLITDSKQSQTNLMENTANFIAHDFDSPAIILQGLLEDLLDELNTNATPNSYE